MKAVFQNSVLADSDNCIVMENNYYFPPEAVTMKYLQTSTTHSVCPWKGIANYYDVIVNGRINADAAWYYPQPKPATSGIKDYITFWKNITIEP
ncbi:MAG: DUF427 domain-containing protein [Pseudomonadota bacterium]